MNSSVKEIKEVTNRWDNFGLAFKITLACGHHFFVTGNKVMNICEVDCKLCGGTGKVSYYH